MRTKEHLMQKLAAGFIALTAATQGCTGDEITARGACWQTTGIYESATGAQFEMSRDHCIPASEPTPTCADSDIRLIGFVKSVPIFQRGSLVPDTCAVVRK